VEVNGTVISGVTSVTGTVGALVALTTCPVSSMNEAMARKILFSSLSVS
jgi:hypothetical protein